MEPPFLPLSTTTRLQKHQLMWDLEVWLWLLSWITILYYRRSSIMSTVEVLRSNPGFGYRPSAGRAACIQARRRLQAHSDVRQLPFCSK